MHAVDELLERHERHIRRTVRRSWFQKGIRHLKEVIPKSVFEDIDF